MSRSLRVSASAAALILVVGACGGGGGGSPKVAHGKAAGATSAAGVADTTTTGPAAASPSGTAPSAAASGSGAAAASSPASAAAATGAAGDPAALSPAAAGTYKYQQSGTTTEGANSSPVPPEGRLVVGAAAGDHSQVMTRYVRDGDPPEETTFVFRDGGVFLRRFVIKTGLAGAGFDFTCDFSPEVPAPPWPAKVGATVSASGNCGTFNAKVDGKISGVEDTQLDGHAVKVWVVELTLALSGQVTGTVHQVDRFAPTLSLSVKENRDMDIRYGFSRYQSSIASVLESGRPS